MLKHLGEYLVSFGIWGYLALLLSILSGINTYSNITGNPIPVFTIIPTWGWLTLLILGLLIMPFFAFNKARTKLDSYENVEPNIMFEQACESPLYRRYIKDDKVVKTDPIYHVLQVWFKNKPIKPQEQSTAKGVTADIEFWDENSQNKIFRVSGQWVTVHQAPDFIGFDKTNNRIDILPNDEAQKLLIALKWEDESGAYGYAKESFVYSQTMDGRDDGRKLPKGEYSVCVRLNGIGVDKLFWFTLINPGREKSLELHAKSQA